MANVLLLDGSDLAGRAMAGILERGNHRCAHVHEAEEAWSFIREHVKVDLLITEQKLPGGKGVDFVRRLRADVFLKSLPVVVYTAVSDQPVVKSALALKVQNYLIKPYQEESIFHEVARAAANPWRSLHFEEERSFCAQMGLSPEQLAGQRRELVNGLDAFARACGTCADGKPHPELLERIAALTEDAETAGVWAVVDFLAELRDALEAEQWNALSDCGEPLGFATRLIEAQLSPGHVPAGFITEAERREAQEKQERERWLSADVDAGGPLVERAQVERAIDGLSGCPVMDAVAAGFQMVADGSESRLSQVMDQVALDPGLTAQVLAAATRLKREDTSPVEDPRAAVGLLGEIRLHSLARNLPIINERFMYLPPVTWPHYWIFQVAVARLATFTARYLEFRALGPVAQTAGLLHDVGKLVLLHTHPHAFRAVLGYAREKAVPLAVAETRYLGCTTRFMAEHFAAKAGLPRAYLSVIRWVESPEEATEDEELVAVVALARQVCLRNRVGSSGEPFGESAPPLAETAAWSVLQPRVFPSFDLEKYEAVSRRFCADVRRELMGRVG